MFGIAYFFVTLFFCGNPTQYYIRYYSNTCLSWAHSEGPLTYTHSALNALTDWLFVILPIFIVGKVQMARRARTTVICILALGVVGSICSVVRLAYVDLLSNSTSSKNSILKHAPKFAILSVIEVGLGITASSASTLRPLFSSILGHTSVHYTTRPTVPTHGLPTNASRHLRTAQGLPEEDDDSILRRSAMISNAPNGGGVKEGQDGIFVVAEVDITSEKKRDGDEESLGHESSSTH